MPPFNNSAESFLTRLRGLFGRRSRAVVACLLVLVSGMPIRPEEMEEQMRSMSKAEIAQALEREQRPDADPPGEEEAD